jgi:hypothetical protein
MNEPSIQDMADKVVDAMRRLVIFGVDQTGAYRELFGPVAEHLGAGAPTRLGRWLQRWATTSERGAIVLTGNAGTGKTAVAETFCTALGGNLPTIDGLTEVGDALIAKDISGIPTREERAATFRRILTECQQRKILACANEGILRDAAEDLSSEHMALREALDDALHIGASLRGSLLVVNVNRQRITAIDLWDNLLDFLTGPSLWSGCTACPIGPDSASIVGCPIRANAEALRRRDTRAVLRRLFQAASGEAVPTVREFLAILAYAICGDASGDAGESRMWSCETARTRARDRGQNAFTASSAYFNLILGAGLSEETRERSPLLKALVDLGVGDIADLEVDNWLRDSGSADPNIRRLAGAPGLDGGDGLLSGSCSHLDRVRTTIGEMTFHRLGEIASISEDEEKVKACVNALIAGDPPVHLMWRRRVVFESAAVLGGPDLVLTRLVRLSHAADLINLAERVAQSKDIVTDIKNIVKGLNFLVTGFADASEGLIVPDPSSLFARNPGAFRRASPTFVHARITADRLGLEVLDKGFVAELLDVDAVEVRLIVGNDHRLTLTIGPRMYQAINEAARYRGPVGHGISEMTDLRSFYGRLAEAIPPEPGLQVADPARSALVRIQLPHFPSYG